jgi:hypothetical protein
VTVTIKLTYRHAPTNTVDVGGTRFPPGELGADASVPVIILHHLTTALDDCCVHVKVGSM